jgi:hypothetical protein
MELEVGNTGNGFRGELITGPGTCFDISGVAPSGSTHIGVDRASKAQHMHS